MAPLLRVHSARKGPGGPIGAPWQLWQRRACSGRLRCPVGAALLLRVLAGLAEPAQVVHSPWRSGRGPPRRQGCTFGLLLLPRCTRGTLCHGTGGREACASEAPGPNADRQAPAIEASNDDCQEGAAVDGRDGDQEFESQNILESLMGDIVGDEEDLLGDGTLMKSIIVPAPKFTRRPQLGDEVTVHFVGTLEDGKVFDDTRRRGEPYKFNVGLEQVIKGWDKGLPTMMKGERALFTIDPALAYGEAGAGWKIPPKATVRFDIELLGFDELDDMSSEFDEADDLAYAREEGIGRGDVGPGGEDPAGRYRWERRGQEVVVLVPLLETVSSRDIVGEFLPRRVRVTVGGQAVLDGTPGCDLDWEECTWNIDEDTQGRRCLLVHLQKKDALKARWPPSLFKEEGVASEG